MPEAFSIHTLTVGCGGRIGICRLPGLDGDPQADLETIRRWEPGVVVSLTEQAEMEACGGGRLSGFLAGAGIGWVHFPIRDYGGPDARGRTSWPALGRRLHGIVKGGGGIVLHCRGGRGRSGMIALRLLVEQGEPASDALRRLREIRPGAVETDEQLAWASVC
jgi:protein-tyrosine phosphatase